MTTGNNPEQLPPIKGVSVMIDYKNCTNQKYIEEQRDLITAITAAIGLVGCVTLLLILWGATV
jgi:hypothetical protein